MADRKNLLKAIIAIGQEVVRRSSSAHSSANIDQADALIKEMRSITINEHTESLGLSAGSSVKIKDNLGYSKVCAR